MNSALTARLREHRHCTHLRISVCARFLLADDLATCQCVAFLRRTIHRSARARHISGNAQRRRVVPRAVLLQIFAHYSAMRLRKQQAFRGRQEAQGIQVAVAKARAHPGHEASPGRLTDKSRRSATTPAPLPHPQAARFAGIQLINLFLPHTNAIRRIAPRCFSVEPYNGQAEANALFMCDFDGPAVVSSSTWAKMSKGIRCTDFS